MKYFNSCHVVATTNTVHQQSGCFQPIGEISQISLAERTLSAAFTCSNSATYWKYHSLDQKITY